MDGLCKDVHVYLLYLTVPVRPSHKSSVGDNLSKIALIIVNYKIQNMVLYLASDRFRVHSCLVTEISSYSTDLDYEKGYAEETGKGPLFDAVLVRIEHELDPTSATNLRLAPATYNNINLNVKHFQLLNIPEMLHWAGMKEKCLPTGSTQMKVTPTYKTIHLHTVNFQINFFLANFKFFSLINCP